jgi:trypsin-like peptidase
MMQRKSGVRRVWLAVVVSSWPALVGCSAGEPSKGFINPRLTDAYIPLSQSRMLVFGRWGAALAVTPDVAVTNDHNLNLIPPDRVLARSRDYDLLFFRTEQRAAPEFANPLAGEQVIAYGQGSERDLREAKGAIEGLDEYVAPRCGDCRTQRAITFDADAGGGFSGGPVVDAGTGAVVALTFGYLDGQGMKGGRRMYAYDIGLVLAEMHRLLDSP